MLYRAVQNRCAVNLSLLELPISDIEAIQILESKKFKVLKIDIIDLARQCIGTSVYRRGAKSSEAPTIVDCSSFVKWLYGQRGIWLPRRSIQQREFGLSVSINEIDTGDIVFTSGYIDYYYNNPEDGVGHVGIVTEKRTIIHAANKSTNVIESPLEDFIDNNFRGVRRYIPKDQEIITFEIPIDREIETNDDLRWIIFQSLSR